MNPYLHGDQISLKTAELHFIKYCLDLNQENDQELPKSSYTAHFVFMHARTYNDQQSLYLVAKSGLLFR